MISVIIPTYNSSSTIKKVLDSVYQQDNIGHGEFEVIVVDDCSLDNTVSIVKSFPVRLTVFKKNSGPATVRNRGMEEAKGELAVFLDSDVVLKKDALINIKKEFDQNKDIVGLVGIYAKEPANPGPFRDYLALRKYSNWHDPRQEFTSFWVVSLGAIKKKIFWEFGGFDTRYRGADVEDFELGYRITSKYKIILAENVQGFHYFPSFTKTIKVFYQRCFLWLELFAKRKKFSSEAAATKKRAFANLAGFLSSLMLICGFWLPVMLKLAILPFLVFVIGNSKFYKFVIKEKGFIFCIYCLLLDYIFSAVVSTAAGLSILNQCRLSVIHK